MTLTSSHSALVVVLLPGSGKGSLEKVGGTLHIAIGMSYEDCFVEDPGSDEGRAKLEQLAEAGVCNRSAQHVDIVTDFRPGGSGRRVLLDDKVLAVRDGLWVVP